MTRTLYGAAYVRGDCSVPFDVPGPRPRYGTDRRDTTGMTPAELVDEMEWRALEDAANEADSAWGRSYAGDWPMSQRPYYKATPALDKITPAKRKVLDARPLVFTGKYPDRLPRPKEYPWDSSHLTQAQWVKACKAAQRERMLSQTTAP